MDKLTWYDNDGGIMCRRGYEVALARLASYGSNARAGGERQNHYRIRFRG